MKTASCILTCAGLALAAAPVPRPTPQFEIKRTGGQAPLRLSSFQGKPVALLFISTTCPHCQELTTKLVPMAKEFGDRVQFLECAISASNGADVPGFVSQFQPPFPVGFNDEAAVHKYLDWSFAQILYVPHIVILDAKGVIRGDYAGESDFVKNAAENIGKELNKLLGASTASPKTAKKKK